MNMFRNLLGIRYLDKNQILELLDLTHDFRIKYYNNKDFPDCSKTNIGLLFSSNSRRTKSSFQQAANLVGSNCVEYSLRKDDELGSESFKDAIKTISQEFVDILVIRHSSAGSALYTTKFFTGPVINAGDGNHEHPTQAFADASTILHHFKSMDGLVITMVGDFLESRIARSNAWLFSKLGAEVRWIGPKNLLPTNFDSLPVKIYSNLDDAMCNTNVIFCLRMKKHRLEDRTWGSFPGYIKSFQINKKRLKSARSDAIILHAGPVNRGIEIEDTLVDSDVFHMGKQIENGLFARSASIYWVLQNKNQLEKSMASTLNQVEQ